MEGKVVNDKKWFLTMRSESLAIVHLTRRDDLIVTRKQNESGAIDLMVTITRAGIDTGRMFGVKVKGVMSSRNFQPVISKADEFQFKGKGEFVPEDFPFPLCQFVFVMENDDAYYKWIKRPMLATNRRQVLTDRSNIFKKLDRASLDEIVTQVEMWYEARIESLPKQVASQPAA